MNERDYLDLEMSIAYFDASDVVTESVDEIPVTETDMGEWFQ